MQRFRYNLLGIILLCLSTSLFAASETDPVLEAGEDQYETSCSFCHGLDARGGNRGPDLLRSELITGENNQQTLTTLLREGRPEAGMPPIDLGAETISAILAYLENQIELAASNNGGRRSVTPQDLAIGDPGLGQAYFDQHCSTCHSVSGDLAGIANRLEGLPLMMRMLYPAPGRDLLSRQGKPVISLVTASGDSHMGTLIYQDEFTVTLLDDKDEIHSWQARDISFQVQDQLQAHVDQLDRYSDSDIHNVYAFLMTLTREDR